MIYTKLTKKAMDIAYKAHHGQKDKGGFPYINHPLHLAEQMDDEYSTCVALLHDVVEDSDITLNDSNAIVKGVPSFSGAPVMASDLRASAGLVIAALMAENESTVHRIYHLDRGYEGFEVKLNKLGANIVRASDNE